MTSSRNGARGNYRIFVAMKASDLRAGCTHPMSMVIFVAFLLSGIAFAKFMALAANGGAPKQLGKMKAPVERVEYGTIGMSSD